MERRSALIVGYFATPSGRGNRGVCEDLADRLTEDGWTIYRTSAYQNRFLRLLHIVRVIWRWRRHYAVSHVDLFSGNAFRLAEVVTAVLRLVGKSYVFTLHGGELPDFATAHPERVRCLLASAVAVTAPSNYLYEKMQSYRADIQLIPNPIDVRLYTYRPRQQAQPRLIWLRALHATYNPLLAVEVVARLLPEFPDLQLSMIGPDKGDGTYQAVESAVAALGLTDHVALVGGVAKADVPMWLDRGDVFINTTNVDNTPISVMEAMASGLPIVSTNVGGLPYLINEGVNGLLVPPSDAEAMAAAIKRVLRNPALAESLSRHAREHAETFDWKIILPRWNQLLLDCTESR